MLKMKVRKIGVIVAVMVVMRRRRNRRMMMMMSRIIQLRRNLINIDSSRDRSLM